MTGTTSIGNGEGPRTSLDTLRQKTPAPASFMSKVIGTEMQIGHAQRLSKLIKTGLEINENFSAKRFTIKFYEHLFSSSGAVIFSETDGRTETWMGVSLG